MALDRKYLKSIIVLVTFLATTSGQRCMSSLITDGYTVPQGDITLRFGQALNITCNLCKEAVDKYGVNASSRLFFTRDNEPIPREMVKIVNSTSINLYIADHPKTKEDNYYCYFNTTEGSRQMICMNVVYVGVAPQNVTDFSCISRNYDNLTCTWTSPENYVKTNYNLTYNVKSRSARFLYNCPEIKTENHKNSCFWNLSTTPQYRPVHECYYFAIAMSNSFGMNMNYVTFDHFKHVLPNPPENLTVVATSPHSIQLSWTIPNSMVTFQPGLDHRILYQWEYEKKWHMGGIIKKVKNKTLTFELKNLKYAHILYDIRISMRSTVANESDESMWSQNATRTIRTMSKVPDCPPNTTVGSFQILNNEYSRNVYIYWQQLQIEQHNGQNLTYVIKTNSPSINKVESQKSYGVLENLSFYREYVINIWSVNEKGYSSEKSTVIIPAKPLDKPFNFIKEHSGDLYELSWKPPQDRESAALITNYTIFWCQNERDRPSQCAGDLSWKVVSRDTRRFTRSLPVTGIYQFAISANSMNSSSGMSWADCTIIPNKSKGKIENVWIKQVDSHFIEVGWSLDCTIRINTIQGFVIYYCPMEKPTQTSCKNGTEKNVTIKGDVHVKSGMVTGLTPHTSYRLTVSYILNNFTYSLPSQPLRNHTSEAAPTEPLNLIVTNLTNTSISLKWDPPATMNGYLKNYYVYYNNGKINTKTERQVVLTDLMSFTNYTIAVEACTVACSKHSAPINVTTKMWVPGQINQPIIKPNNESYITIEWERPNPARGEIDYYQVRIKESSDAKDYLNINVTATNYTLESCASGKYKQLYISVRAVNIIENAHQFGPWSYDLQTSCTPYSSVVYVLICSLVIFLGIVMLCVFKRLYRCYREDRSFVPKLPPGLEPTDPWDSEKIKDMESSPPPDVQRLLQKSKETRLSGDSSGCSSGQESITSSLESTAHISPSDSGTEQPRTPSLNEENRKNSLRLRNVSAAPRLPVNIGYVTADTLPLANLIPKPATPIPGNYSVIGVDNSITAKADVPYVSITDVNSKIPFSSEQPPPYVVTGNLVKAINPGYVPYTVAEPADKNMAYVVAGLPLPKDLLASDLIQCDTPKPAISEEKPLYMRAGEAIPTLKPQFPWQQPQPQPVLPKVGYVSVGDAPPPKSLTETSKGYVPHRQFEGKSLKKD